MKKIILALAVISLAGCTIPQQLKNSQRAESVALHQYHKAQRDAYKAGELVQASKKALVAATTAKAAADMNVKLKQEALDKVLHK